MKRENYKFGRYILSDNDSRWADIEEIRNAATITQIDIEAGDCSSGGIPIISDGRTAFVDGSDTHSLIFGSTGSKKTRLFGMPLINILAMAGESFIATDPKGELYSKTSGLVAAKGYDTYVLNFRDVKQSDYWNPLQLPHYLYHNGNTDEAISLLNDFLNAVAEPHKKGAKDPYFAELSYSLALAHLLFFVETTTPAEANIFNYANFCAAKSTPEDVERFSDHIAENSVAFTNYKGILANKAATSTYGNVVAGYR
jgi:type IV secretion system protein VirD4